MGRIAGALGIRVRGVVQYTLSPFEMKAFANAFTTGAGNMFRRFSGEVFKIVTPLSIGYMIYDWGEKEGARLERKNPKDFENDE